VRRLGPYLVTAAIGLGAGGGASAAGGLVTGKQVRDKSIHAREFSPAARKALRRVRGRRGPSGARGLEGPVGPSSPAASSSAFPSATASLVAAGPVAASGTQYLEIGARGSTASEADAQLVVPMSLGYVMRMRARVAEAGSGLRQFRLRANESASIKSCCGEPAEYTCSIQPGERTCISPVTGYQGEVRVGDRVSVQVVNASSSPTEASVIFEIRAY
jgi:hypothetical protein